MENRREKILIKSEKESQRSNIEITGIPEERKLKNKDEKNKKLLKR